MFLYLRLFSSRNFQRQCYAVIVIIVLFGLSSTILVGLQCKPLSFLWDGWQTGQPGNCIQQHVEVYAYAALNIVLDLWILLLPIPQLIGLPVSLRMKLTASTMFAIGLFVTACSTARLVIAIKWNHYGASRNPTYDYADGMTRTAADAGQGEWEATGVESNSKFTGIDLTEGEWFDYDEKAGDEVSIKDIKWAIKRA